MFFLRNIVAIVNLLALIALLYTQYLHEVKLTYFDENAIFSANAALNRTDGGIAMDMADRTRGNDEAAGYLGCAPDTLCGSGFRSGGCPLSRSTA